MIFPGKRDEPYRAGITPIIFVFLLIFFPVI
jgi:hypothetical protein